LATLVAHTTSPCGSQFEVAAKARFLKPGVFDAQNLVTVPHAKIIRKLGDLSADQFDLVEEAVKRWLGLTP
jgi:mRNA interferase MazF